MTDSRTRPFCLVDDDPDFLFNRSCNSKRPGLTVIAAESEEQGRRDPRTDSGPTWPSSI